MRGGELRHVLPRHALEAALDRLGELQAVEALGAGEIVILEPLRLLGGERPHHVAVGDLVLFDVDMVHGQPALPGAPCRFWKRSMSSLKRWRARKRTRLKCRLSSPRSAQRASLSSSPT